MGQAVDRLIALGETQARVAALLEISTQEVKRLKSRPAGPDQAEPVEGEADQEE
jgi:predicted transcriptional regulator